MRPLIGRRATLGVSGLVPVGVGALAVVVLVRLLPVAPSAVPGRPGVRTVIWPLVPALAALAVPLAARVRWREWAWVGPRPRWHQRTVVLVLLCGQATVVVVAVPRDRLVLGRNLVLFDGLALVASVAAGAPCWWPVLVVPVVCWFVGVDPPDTVRGWALPLRPATDGAAMVAAGALAAAGAGSFLWGPRGAARGPASRWRRPWRRRPRRGPPRRAGAGWP